MRPSIATLRAFDSGTMPDTGLRTPPRRTRRAPPGTRRLPRRTAGPRQRHNHHYADRQQLEVISDLVHRLLSNKPSPAGKDLLAALVDSVQIGPGQQAKPFFRLPTHPQQTTPEPRTVRASTSPAQRTPIRMDCHDVELTGFEPVTP
jgi:hypothetical protein